MQCPNFEKCKFFSAFGNQKCAEALVMLYCKGDYKDCARFKMKEEGKEPPQNLWPNGQIV
ncbi:MAG: hypothetical protein OHK0040_01090 [bacterium]